MPKLERFFIVGLGVLVVLAVAIVVIGPRLVRPTATQQSLGPGETETLTARVVEVLEEGSLDLGDGMEHPYQRLLLYVESGSLAGQEIAVEEGTVNIVSEDRLFDAGDRVFLERVVGPEGDHFYISDPVRTAPLSWIALLFVGLVLLTGRGKGLRSLVGTLLSLVVLFGLVLPVTKAGHLPRLEAIQCDPVTASVAGSVVLLAASTYLIYGWNYKAHAAVAGMMLSLTLTLVLAQLFARWTRLTGLSEEAGFLLMELGPSFDLRGLLLAGIIIGSLGVLDDICVGQASAVFELANVNRDLSWRQLFHSSLNIGRDHIAAMVNTLLLAYVGASMPLMVAFVIYVEPVWRRINREPIAEEIVRTLVGSMGLVLAVPVTGLIASLLARWAVRQEARTTEQVENESF
jgi:uncharacterized membrane protein